MKPGRYHVVVCADASRQLPERNERNNCRASADRLAIVLSSNRRSALVGRGGGAVQLPSVGAIEFGPGSLGPKTRVDLARVQDKSLTDPFALAHSLFEASDGPSYLVRATVGAAQPGAAALLRLEVPADFGARVPAGSEIRVMLLNVWTDELERIDSYELAPERFPADAREVLVSVPAYFFTNADARDGRYRVTAVLTTTPTASPSSLTRAPAAVARRDGATCKGNPIGSPLADLPTPRSPFGPRKAPLKGASTFHAGADYAVPSGTPVLAVADGHVESAGNRGKGGYAVVIRHDDGSGSVYMHLEDGSAQFAPGAVVRRGDVIARSDNTGNSTGPHLHFGYAPNGKVWEGGTVDPQPCIENKVSGSITVRDNGDLADDAFDVRVNDVLVCQTQTGEPNTCPVGGLRPGTATLTITARIAPDDEGTYGIELSDGLTFSDGGTSQEGTIEEGASATYEIVVPG